MELIIGLIVIIVVGYFVFFRKKDDAVTPSAPYKVEQPVQAADVAPQPVAVEGAGQVAIANDFESRMWEKSLANLEKEKVVEEAPAKKPRKPRAPKAEKPAAKKAAPKKAAAIKAKSKPAKSKKV